MRDTITVPESVTSFTAYKGVISLASVLNSVRMRFSGSYPYSIRDRAFYANLYASASKVPDYTPYVTYTMPSDFFEIDKVINTTDNQIYNDTLDYRRVGRREIVFSYDTKGEIDAHISNTQSICMTKIRLLSIRTQHQPEHLPTLHFLLAQAQSEGSGLDC